MAGYPLETVTFLYAASLAMSAFFQNNLLLRKACNATVPFGECVVGEASAQLVVSGINSWKALIQYVVPVTLIILAGPWSDSHGRKRRPLIFLPLIGQILTDSLCLLNVYYWAWPPQIAAIFEAITPGLFGGRIMYWVGVISYTSDNFPNELRTLKYGVINAIYTISTLVGVGLAGYINVYLGFYGAFMVSISLNLISALTCLIFIKDSSTPYAKNVVWLRPKHFFRSYISLFKKKPKNYAVTLAALILCQSILVGRIGGEYSVVYLFMRFKFQWYEVMFSYFAAYKMLTISAGTIFAVTVLSHRFKINDAVIGLVACISDIFAALCYVFATEPWQIYIIPLVDFFHGTALTISTSLTCKLVDNDELGRLNSVLGLTTTVVSFFTVALYSATYHFTFRYLAGAVFLLNVFLTLPVLIVYTIIHYKCKYLWTKSTDSRNDVVS